MLNISSFLSLHKAICLWIVPFFSFHKVWNDILYICTGDVTTDELMSKLIQDHEVFADQQQRDVIEEVI